MICGVRNVRSYSEKAHKSLPLPGPVRSTVVIGVFCDWDGIPPFFRITVSASKLFN